MSDSATGLQPCTNFIAPHDDQGEPWRRCNACHWPRTEHAEKPSDTRQQPAFPPPPEDHDITMITEVITIVRGIDSEGMSSVAFRFAVEGTDPVKCIDWITGLGMLEAAKDNFNRRHGYSEEDNEN